MSTSDLSRPDSRFSSLGAAAAPAMAKVPPEPVMDEDSMQIVLEYATRELDAFASVSRHIDTKMGVVLGFVLVAAGQVLASVLGVSPARMELLRQHPVILHLVIGLTIFSLVAVFAAMVFGLITLRPIALKSWTMEEVLEQPGLPRKQLLDSLLQGLKGGCIKNEQTIRRKCRLARWAAYSVGAAIFSYLLLGVLFGILLVR